MKDAEKLDAIRTILAASEGKITIPMDLLVGRLRRNELEILKTLLDEETVTAASISRVRGRNYAGTWLKKGFESLEKLGLIEKVKGKGKAKPYRLTRTGELFLDHI